MAYTLNRFESMLVEFLIEEQSDAHNRKSINYNKYNNLKITMMPEKIKDPHVVIRIGISEACYRLSDFEIISGSVGFDSKLVIKWLKKVNIKDELMATWTDLKKLDILSLIRDEELQ